MKIYWKIRYSLTIFAIIEIHLLVNGLPTLVDVFKHEAKERTTHHKKQERDVSKVEERTKEI